MSDERRDQQSSSGILKNSAGSIPMESEGWKILSTLASAQTYPPGPVRPERNQTGRRYYFLPDADGKEQIAMDIPVEQETKRLTEMVSCSG